MAVKNLPSSCRYTEQILSALPGSPESEQGAADPAHCDVGDGGIV
jgi:hypothetical protein